MKIELDMTEEDFDRLTETTAPWRDHFHRPGDGWAIQLGDGRFENMDREGLPPEARDDWEFAYWLSDRRADVILARSFLKAHGHDSELLWDMRDALDGGCSHVLLTNYKVPERRTEDRIDLRKEQAVENAYNALAQALQELEHLGENLKLMPAGIQGQNPNFISGKSGLVARYDFEWQIKLEERQEG